MAQLPQIDVTMAFVKNLDSDELHLVFYVGKVRYSAEECNLDDARDLLVGTAEANYAPMVEKRCGHCWPDGGGKGD